jgi:exodeoxyribonuclease V alpha subunit
MDKINLHHHFAKYFKEKAIEPYLYVLSKRMESGHICIPIDNTIQDELAEIDVTLSSIDVEGSALISRTGNELKPFVFFGDKLYLQRYFQYETNVIERLKEKVAQKNQFDQRKAEIENCKDFILKEISKKEDVSNYGDDEKPDWQAIAAIQGVLNNLTIITGGPGTGKTTTVAKVLGLLKKTNDENLSVALAAPTGKAAVRMKESLQDSVKKFSGLDISDIVEDTVPKTLHRLLGTKFNSPFFKHNRSNPLPFDIVIVDECSMVSVAMFSKLLDAIGPNTRLILLGDSDQLASVDAGSLFGDICRSQELTENKFTRDNLDWINSLLQSERYTNQILGNQSNFLNEHLIRLKKTYRYDQSSKMGQFTKAVINGDIKTLNEVIVLPDDGKLSIDFEYSKNFFEDFIKKYTTYINEVDIEKALKNMNDCRVLCAVKQTEQGVYQVNERIQNYLKNLYKEKNESKLFNPSSEFYHNQLLMVTRNQPDLSLFNGDVGIVRGERDKLKVYFPSAEKDLEKTEKKYIEVNPWFIEQWETVFAMTIHKSQGSEFNEVFVILPKKTENRILTRELLYTGITRAKNHACIQSTLEVLESTTNQKVNRVSGINERIQSNSL